MPDGPLSRDWRLIAQEAAQEEDPSRLAELMEELTRALNDPNDVKPDQSHNGGSDARLA